MPTQLPQLQKQLHQDLSYHRQNLSDWPAVKKALATARAGLTAVTQTHPSKKSSNSHTPTNYSLLSSDFSSAYQYLKKVDRALEIKSDYGTELFASHIDQELSDVNDYLRLHLRFTQYTLFSLTESSDNPDFHTRQDPAASSPGHFPELKAYMEYKQFLEHEKKQTVSEPSSLAGDLYQFLGTQAQALEQIEGWMLIDVIRINGQKPNMRQMADMWSNIFHQAIPNIYHKRRVNKNRKKQKAPFLGTMLQLLTTQQTPAKRHSASSSHTTPSS